MNKNFSHLDLINCRRIFLKNLIVEISIGVYDYEKQKKQTVVIDVDLYVSLSKTTPKEDKLEEVLNYEWIRNVILERIFEKHINLLETLCDDIAQVLLESHFAQAVRVSVTKGQVFHDCSGVGVEVFLFKK